MTHGIQKNLGGRAPRKCRVSLTIRKKLGSRASGRLNYRSKLGGKAPRRPRDVTEITTEINYEINHNIVTNFVILPNHDGLIREWVSANSS